MTLIAKMTDVRFYIGIIHKDEGSDFGISFPDFPGCISAGAVLDETLAMGREPSAINAIMADADCRERRMFIRAYNLQK